MKLEPANFERLRVYQLAERLADEIWSVAMAWDFFAKDTVGKQLVRAADSIGANIAEGMDVTALSKTGVLSAQHAAP